MANTTQTIPLEIPCPGCGAQNLFELRTTDLDPHFTCAGCGQRVDVDASGLVEDLASAQKKLEASVAKLARDLKKR